MEGRLLFNLGLIFFNILYCMAQYKTITLKGGDGVSKGNVFFNNKPVCDNFWDEKDGAVVCRQLGFHFINITHGSRFGKVPFGYYNFAFHGDGVECDGDEKNIDHCSFTNRRHKHHCLGAGVICDKSSSFRGLVTLRGGDDFYQGNVFIDGEPVCDDGWDDDDGTVICKELGLKFEKITIESYFGSVSRNFAMDEVNCTGEDKMSQPRLFYCGHKTDHDCSGGEGAGVICKKPKLASLLGGDGYSKGYIMINNMIFCNRDTDVGVVICRERGLDFKKLITYGTERVFGQLSGNFSRSASNCRGDEDRFEQCGFWEDPYCDAGDESAVICKIPLEVSLRGGDDNTSGNVYINNQPLCNDNWNATQGAVVCRQLGLYLKLVTHESNFGNVTTDVHETYFTCTGTEDNLDHCTESFSYQDCGPFDAVGVICVKSLEDQEPTFVELMKVKVSNEKYDRDGRIWRQYDDPTYWRNILAYDTDTNKDGRVSGEEIEDKLEIYMQGLFEILDQDKNGFITENELRLLKINLNGCQNILNAALESYPLKMHILQYFKEATYDKVRYLGLNRFEVEEDTFEEVKHKFATFVPTVFNILDQNSDGYISLEDGIASILSDNLKLKIMGLFDILADYFEDDMFNITTILDGYDNNGDGKLNAKDLYQNLHRNGHLNHFLIQLNIKLDNNQDGDVQRPEMEQFLTQFLAGIDSNKDESIAFDDFVNLYRSMDFSSVQTQSMEHFVKEIKSYIKEGSELLVKNIITEQDRNGDRKTDIEELMNARIPCGTWTPSMMGIPYRPCEAIQAKIEPIDLYGITDDLNAFVGDPWNGNYGRREILIMGSSVLDSMCGMKPNPAECFPNDVENTRDDKN